MRKLKLTTTLALLQRHHACVPGYATNLEDQKCDVLEKAFTTQDLAALKNRAILAGDWISSQTEATPCNLCSIAQSSACA